MKHWFKRLMALSLLPVLCAAMTLPAAAGFRDVPQTHWARQAISDMAAKGYLQGSGGSFHPGDPISNQAFLSALCRVAGLDDRKLQSGRNWADPAIAYGQYFGWFSAEELHDREAPITREFAAQLLVKALFSEDLSTDSTQTFHDATQITEGRQAYVQTAVRLGLLTPQENDCFDPQGLVTRASAAVMLQRALQKRETPAPGGSVQVPVLMYHDISYLGHGYSKTPELFKKQMQELKDAGFHTVFFSQVLDYVEAGTPLPAKPIVISIDDGYATNYTYAYPILQELGMKAEISIIGNAIRWAEWGLRWDQLREMTDSGLVRIQCHTQSLHSDTSAQGGRKCVLKLPNESWSSYVELVAGDAKAMQEQITRELGTAPLVYTYPLGQWNTMTEGISAQLGFPISLTTKNGIAVVRQGDPSSLRLMDRIGMDFLNGSVVSVLHKYGYRE